MVPKMINLLYILVPILASLTWLGTLMGLFIRWGVTGKKHLLPMMPSQDVPYLSDVGGNSGENGLFQAGCFTTAILLEACLLTERWLRYTGRFSKQFTGSEKVFFVISIVTSAVGTLGLMLLSIFTNSKHLGLHETFLGCFIGGYAATAMISCWEYHRLGIRNPQNKIFQMSSWVKSALVTVEIILGVSLGIAGSRHAYDVCAVFEWMLAFVFTFYCLTPLIDLHPTARSRIPLDVEGEPAMSLDTS